jgi:kinase
MTMTGLASHENTTEGLVENYKKLRRTTWIFFTCMIVLVVGASVVLCGGGQCSLAPMADDVDPPNINEPPPLLDQRNDTVASVLQPFVGALDSPLDVAANNISAEEWALNWSIYDDPLRNNVSTPQRITQRYALATFFRQPLFGEFVQFHSDECMWFGIECDRNNDVMAIRTPTVTWMNAGAGSWLTSITTIPSALGLLTKLTLLDISHNGIGGSFPIQLSNLNLMEHFNMSENYFTGSLPDLHWPNLRSFLISGFDRGTLPESIGKWTALEQFELNNVWFSGTLPYTISLWTNIREVALNQNIFTGTLPTNLDKWSNLDRFEISSGFFGSPVPSDIQFWTNLRILNLYGLGGTIPKSVANLTSLEKLSLFWGSWTGELPVGDWPNLKYLLLDHSGLTGRSPSKPSWTQLNHYETSYNLFSGGLPVDIGFWTSLVRFYVIEQASTGTVPAGIGRCTNLEDVLIGNTALTGQIPSELWAISGLTSLTIRFSNITGSIPNATMWTNLVMLDLSSNRLSGTIPESISAWTNLRQFLVPDNRLQGSLHHLLTASLPLLDSLDVSRNLFTGHLPDAIWLPTLQTFAASGNQISGSLPSALALSTALFPFSVDDNRLTGTIPAEFAENWTSFSIGYFQGNRFQGTMPFCYHLAPPSLVADCNGVEFRCDCCVNSSFVKC